STSRACERSASVRSRPPTARTASRIRANKAKTAALLARWPAHHEPPRRDVARPGRKGEVAERRRPLVPARACGERLRPKGRLPRPRQLRRRPDRRLGAGTWLSVVHRRSLQSSDRYSARAKRQDDRAGFAARARRLRLVRPTHRERRRHAALPPAWLL